MLIEFAGPDTAIVETNVMLAQHYPEDGDPLLTPDGKSLGRQLDMFAFARYVDRFERRDGKWLVQDRTVVMDSEMLVEAQPARVTGGMIRGRRDSDDPVYRIRSAAGL
jgi:hypothetical protein